MGIIAQQPHDFILFQAPTFERKKTTNYETSALSALNDYKHYRQITDTEYKRLRKEIVSAPHDDAISSIMTRLRKKVYG